MRASTKLLVPAFPAWATEPGRVMRRVHFFCLLFLLVCVSHRPATLRRGTLPSILNLTVVAAFSV